MMDKDKKTYDPPKAKIYQFDNNDRILTDSGNSTPSPEPTPNYAANALNQLFGGTNTTIE